MKNRDLIKLLKQFDEELEVTTSNKLGSFNDIVGVEKQEWEDKNNKHASITLVLRGYDNSKTKVKEPIIEVELNDDEEFIDNVNKNLKDSEKIDKKDAMNAKSVFDVDINKMQKKYKEWFNKKYDNVAHSAMIELFDDDTPLENKTIGDLKFYIYKNGWQDEIQLDELNNRAIVLRLLYGKLDERVKEKMSKNLNNTWDDVMGENRTNENCNCKNKPCQNNKCSKRKNSLEDFFEMVDNLSIEFDRDLFSDFDSNLKKFGRLNRLFF